MRAGSAERSFRRASRGGTWALSFADLYSPAFCGVPAATVIVGSPPWQSAQPRKTVPVGCMVGSSLCTWQVTQPVDLASASCWVWPRSAWTDSCRPVLGRKALRDCKAKAKKESEVQSASRSRTFARPRSLRSMISATSKSAGGSRRGSWAAARPVGSSSGRVKKSASASAPVVGVVFADNCEFLRT
jgi:hypothetical protein